MDRTERFYKINQLLAQRRSVPIEVFLEELGISRATFKRDLEYMRDRLNAPIIFDRERHGYRFDDTVSDGPEYVLPGLWFNSSEILALLTMDHLLKTLQPSLLAPHIDPLRKRITALLESTDPSADEIRQRIQIVGSGYRPVNPGHFEKIADALFRRVRLMIRHYNRGNDRTTERSVSPLRLTYHKGNWYLDTWCHLREGIRRFGMDAIEILDVEETEAIGIDDETLNKELGSGFGAFVGSETEKAVLIFETVRARWVVNEIWHQEQVGELLPDGRYRLEVPYTNYHEMAEEVLKYGGDVTVESPDSLRRLVACEAKAILKKYR